MINLQEKISLSQAKIANMESAILEEIKGRLGNCNPEEAHDLLNNIAAEIEDLQAEAYSRYMEYVDYRG